MSKRQDKACQSRGLKRGSLLRTLSPAETSTENLHRDWHGGTSSALLLAPFQLQVSVPLGRLGQRQQESNQNRSIGPTKTSP